MSASSPTNRELPDPTFLYDLARSQLDQQLAFIDAVETKIGLFFSLGSAQIGVSAAFLALADAPKLAQERHLLIAAGGSYAVLVVASVVGLMASKWWFGPDILKVVDLYAAGLDEPEVKRRVVRRLLKAWDDNERRFLIKRIAMYIAVLAVVIQTGSLSLLLGQLVGLVGRVV